MRSSINTIQDMDAEVPAYRDPGAIAWDYTRTETLADMAVHVAGLCLGVTAAAVLLTLASIHATTRSLVAASIYVLGLLSMLTLSAAYNLWPVCPAKWWLRRFDHSAIYVLIAATYTPFLLIARSGTFIILIAVWCAAALGIAVKLALPGRLDRLSIGVYVAMGWCAVILWWSKYALTQSAAFHLLLAGGMVITTGLIFHTQRKLRFQNAIWHLFVLLGVTFHYAAVLDVVLG
jgi:hemolysin III